MISMIVQEDKAEDILHAACVLLHVHIGDVNLGPCGAMQSLDTVIAVVQSMTISFRCLGWWIMLTHCHVWVENYSSPSRLPRLGRQVTEQEPKSKYDGNKWRDANELTWWRKIRSLRCDGLFFWFYDFGTRSGSSVLGSFPSWSLVSLATP